MNQQQKDLVKSLICRIEVNSANLDHIKSTGIINGSLKFEIEKSMHQYHLLNLDDVVEKETAPLLTRIAELETLLAEQETIIDPMQDKIIIQEAKIKELEAENRQKYATIENLSSTVVEMEKQNGWVSVDDSLPEAMSRVIVYRLDVVLICYGTAFYNGKSFLYDATFVNNEKVFSQVSDKPLRGVTHWIHLLAPPQQ